MTILKYNIKRLYFFCVGFLLSSNIWAATYYISSTDGDDTNSGTDPNQAWKSLEMVIKKCYNSPVFSPGDKILLKRGDTFVGRLQLHYTDGTLQEPIIVGAYGTGNKPVIYGDSRNFDWHPVSDLGVTGHSDCYYADIGYKGYIEKSYSGTDWITRLSARNPVTGLTDDIYDTSGIDAFLDRFYQSWWDNNYPSVTLTDDVCGPVGGYPGRIFIRTADGQSPVYGSDTGEIKLFYTTVEINHGSSHIIVEDLDLREAAGFCKASWADFITLRNLNCQDSLNIGINIVNQSSDISVLNNTITRTGNDAIYFINDNGPYTNCLVSGNDISYRTSNILGYEVSGEATIGIAHVDKLVIEHNYIHDNDREAMDWYFADNVTVRYNFFRNTGGMGAPHGTNVRIHDNILIADPAYNTRGVLIWPQGDSTNYIYNNVFYGLNYFAGITCWYREPSYNVHTYVFNNIIHAANDAPSNFEYICYENSDQVSSFNNCFCGWSNGTPRWIIDGNTYYTLASVQSTGLEKASMFTDPLFVSTPPSAAADLGLQSGSPCLDAGVHPKVIAASQLYDVVKDYNGTWRHSGQGVDIGPFEAAGTGSSTLSNGLLLSCHFDEISFVADEASIVDASGNNYHGAPVGGVAPIAAGKLDGAIDLDEDESGRISFGKLDNWNPTEFTMAFWFKDTGTTYSSDIFAGKLNVRYYSYKKLGLIVYGSQQMTLVVSPTVITADTWYHVVCTYSDTGDRKARIYINGVEYTASSALLGTMSDMSTRTVQLGDNYYGNYVYPEAQVDELNIWNRALNSGEIASLYNSSAGFVVPASDTYPVLDVSSPNFARISTSPYGPGSSATVSTEDKGATIQITGNGWVKIPYAYTVTADTMLSFDYRTTSQGDIHAIGMDNDNTAESGKTFQLDGISSYGIDDYFDYHFGIPGWRHYEIPIGSYYTGSMQYIFFANEEGGVSPDAESEFSNIVVYESS